MIEVDESSAEQKVYPSVFRILFLRTVCFVFLYNTFAAVDVIQGAFERSLST